MRLVRVMANELVDQEWAPGRLADAVHTRHHLMALWGTQIAPAFCRLARPVACVRRFRAQSRSAADRG